MANNVELIFDHIIAKLDCQHSYVASLRNQAAISAAVTGLIGAVFGTLLSSNLGAFDGRFLFGFSAAAVLAVSLFAASIAFSVAVVVHYADFTFSFDCRKMLGNLDASANDNDFLRLYIKDGEWFFRDNEEKIGALQGKLWFAMVLGFVQIVPWVILLGGAN